MGEGSRDMAQYVGVGCLMAIAGFFSGGMIAVLLAKVVSMARGCTPETGLPACDFQYFWIPGILLGAVSLPWLTIRALRRSRASADHTDRS
jgi:hypothetical protein